MGRTFSYDYRDSDIAALTWAAGRVMYPHSVRTGARMGGWALMLLGLGAGAVFGLSFGWTEPLPMLRIVSCAVWGIAGAMITATLGNLFLNQWLVKHAYGAKALEGQPITVEFSEDGVVRRSPQIELTVRWPGVHAAAEHDGALLVASGHGVICIPQRAFESPSARGELLSWVVDQLSPSARERSQALRRG